LTDIRFFRRWGPVRKMAPTTPFLERQCRATMAFSTAVMAEKSRMFWKVRATPQEKIWWGRLPRMLLPSNTDIAAAGLVDAGEHIEHRGFTGTVGADEPDDLTVLM
jgi:hypothetical protein